MFMAPAMINGLITSPEIDKYDLSSLKCINYGGAPMTISYLRKEEHLFNIRHYFPSIKLGSQTTICGHKVQVSTPMA